VLEVAIEELHIRGLGVIDDVHLELAPGLTVVTGETGAGKTMIVTALQLLLGARASSDLVRRGAESATIDAVLTVPAGADVSPAGAWGGAEDGTLIVSRDVPTDGRSRARIGGRPVPVSALAELLGPHVEVHGQHEHGRLARSSVQRTLLDVFAGPDHALALTAYREAYAAWRGLVARAELLRTDSRERARRLAQLTAERDEIDAARIDREVDGRLDQDLERLANVEALREVVSTAVEALGGEEGALDRIATAGTALRRAPGSDAELAALGERLAIAGRDLSDLVADLASAAADLQSDDARLDALQLRRRDLTALMRRYGATLEDVLAHRASVADEAVELLSLEADADGLEGAVATALSAVRSAGAVVSAGRRRAALVLQDAVAGHLRELALAHAELEVQVRPRAGDVPGADGLDDVDVLLAANPGEPAVRLGDGASGGERSRVALAVEVALAEVDDAGVLVFDEVDAGVGGSTALAVGEKLARLAHSGSRPRQVLCVTHLAQVAAFADVHHVVEKVVVDGRTVTRVRRVAEGERVAELSRMLGGEATADAGLGHARGLLEAARVAAGR
jgi:DNA repair protein RecN (Recombination protein N)